MKRCDKFGRTTGVPQNIFVKNVYKGQIGYFTSVMLVFIGFAFFGMFIMQSQSLTGEVISDVDLPGSCDNAEIALVWDSIFQESSTGISILKSDNLVGGKCSEYFANKSDANENNFTYILYGYTREELGENISYVMAEKINATGEFINLLNGISTIVDVAPLTSRDETFLSNFVRSRDINITEVVNAETEFDSIFLTDTISLVGDNFFGDEIFSFVEDLSTMTMNISNDGFVTGNYSYSFFSFSSKEIIVEEEVCVEDFSCGNWSDCINDSQSRTCTDANSCSEDYNETQSCGVMSSNITCVPNWKLGNWSECIGSIQIRTVFDLNSCGNETDKPALNQTCTGDDVCSPNWACGDWAPEECPKEGSQERDCVDSNKCNPDALTKTETKECVYESSTNWILILVVLFVMGSILGAILVVLSLMKKKEDEKIDEKLSGVRSSTSPPATPGVPGTPAVSKPKFPLVQKVAAPVKKIIPSRPFQKSAVPVSKISAMPKLEIPKVSTKSVAQKSVTPALATPVKPVVPTNPDVPTKSTSSSIKQALDQIAKPAVPTKKPIKK